MTDKLLHTALDLLQEAVFILDVERTVKFSNSVAIDLFGDGFVGNDFVQIIRHPECIKAIDEVRKGKESAEYSISIDYPVKANFSVLVSRLGKKKRGNAEILVSLKDISDLREAEQMRSDFVANVSHELRSPLTALAGFIETLRGSAKDDEVARERFLGLMDHEASRMVRLIADLLSLSKLEANLRIRPSGQADVVAIIRRVQTSLNDLAKKESKTVELEIAVPAEASKIPGNEDELTQVFQNLIENAIKYGSQGTTVSIKVDTKESVAGIPGQAVAVEIRDQGEGIPKHQIARLTERFYRVDTHRSRDKGGTGLGLAIVKHIMNHHRGRMHIDSEVGVGSTFTIYLPTSK